MLYLWPHATFQHDNILDGQNISITNTQTHLSKRFLTIVTESFLIFQPPLVTLGTILRSISTLDFIKVEI